MKIFNQSLKNLLPIFFVLTLLSTAGLIAPVIAEEKSDDDPSEASTSETTPAAQKETETTDPAKTPGSEWSGIIVEPANTNITEPLIPTETSSATEVIVTEVVTTVTAPAPNPVPSPAPVAAQTGTSTDVPEESPKESPENSTEVVEAPEASDVSEKIELAESPIPVPKTSREDTTRKIHLMAIISTAIVFFATIGTVSGFKLVKLIRSEKTKPNKDKNPLLKSA